MHGNVHEDALVTGQIPRTLFDFVESLKVGHLEHDTGNNDRLGWGSRQMSHISRLFLFRSITITFFFIF